MKKPSIQMNVILSTLYQILSMITPLITAPYTARILGADGVGINSYTTSINTYFLLLAMLGTYAYGSREIARNRDNKQRRSQSFWEIMILTAITTGICLLAWGIVILTGGQNKIYYLIQTMSLIAVAFEVSWFYAGIERFDHTVLINTAIKLLSIVCVFLFVKEPSHLSRFMIIFSLGNLLGNISMWIFLPRYVQKPDWKKLRIWYHFKRTLIYFVPSIATSVYTVLDKTLIGMITQDTAQNGYYEQTTKIINMAKSVAFVALNNVMSSRLSYLYAQNKHEEIRERTDESMGYITFMCVGITFGLMAVAPDFVLAFFGPEYTEVVTLLRVFSPIVLIIGISNCIASHYYTPIGYHKQVSMFLVVGAVTNLVLNSVLIPTLGSMGAAIASVAAELLITVLHVHYSQGTFTVRYIMEHLWKKLVAAGVMVVVILWLGSFIDRPVLTIAVQVVTGVCIYCAVLLLLKDDFIRPITRRIVRKIKEKILVRKNGGESA